MGDAAVLGLHDIGSNGLRPDLTILVDVDPKAVAQRLARRDRGTTDAIGGRSADYHAAVGSAFRGFAEADPAGFVIIDGNGSVEDVHKRIITALVPLTAGDA